ncbi:hypothetical protein F5B22DRAFT_613658 [Xylaria bambusicola]|uniref:uncharacterized protein n=1 Tax=Xylaria bambusicola TaxID=326684 RepID=UPI002008AB3F|nr:uncharacterized protein F5B22DRAFT_613658 [Xylaria bambusicola]KAI0512899.1 hypothetical protein F5B22DRAFT_613658 [Xylaria bambusicola]
MVNRPCWQPRRYARIMQTLWSRAAQAQSACRCRICLHSTNALTRRTTTAASRRRVTGADLFTACYTTILGTATFIDAHRKNQRREQLDGELSRARAALTQLNVCPGQETTDEEHAATLGTVPAGTLSSELSGCLQPWKGDKSVRPLLEELKSLCNLTFRPVARQSWLEKQVDWVNVEAAIVIEEFNPSIKLREPLSHQSLAATTTTVLRLVGNLLRLTRVPSSRRAQDEAQPTNQAEDNIFAELEILRREQDFPGYQFPTVDPDYTWHIRGCLNRSIRRIFHQAVTPRETVGRISYNLLTVGVPPTIHTYNTLIVGFNRMQRPDLAQAVIDSYLDETAWPATDQTLICLLSHYRGPGGKEGFREAVQKMRGGREDGLHLATVCDEMYEMKRDRSSRKRWKAGAKRTNATFNHLIKGWLYHEDVGIACMTFVACLRHGASLPVHTLHELLRGCLATADFSSARKLLTGIVDNFENFKTYLTWAISAHTVAVVQRLLQSLHQIINICWLPFSEIFGETEKKYATAATSLQAVMSHMAAQLEAQDESLLPSVLSDTSEQLASASGETDAVISPEDNTKLSKRTLTESERLYARIAMLVSIERRFGDLEERVQNLDAALKAAAIEAKTGHSIDVEPIMSPTFLGTPTYEKQRFATRRALSLLDVWDANLTIEDVAIQLFRNIPDKALIGPLEENGNWKRLSIPTLISFFNSTTVSTRSYDGPYEHLEERLEAIKDSTRALIFSHLTQDRQQRVMYNYGFYYNVGTRRLRSYLHANMKYNLPGVLQTSFEAQYNEFSNDYRTTTPLQTIPRENPAALNPVIPSKSNNSAAESTGALKDDWGTAHKQEQQQDPPMF